MKILRIFIALLLVSYLSLMCTSKTEQDKTQQNHAHSEDAGHSHETGAHSHEEDGLVDESAVPEPGDQQHSHESSEHDHGDDELLHENETVEQQQESESHTHGDDTHVHEEDENLDHTHDTADLIPIEGEWEKLIGLQTTAVKTMPLELVISVPGQIVPNQNQVAVVSPFIESSINCVFVNVGDRIKKGDMLVCLSSPEIGIQRAEYDKAKAELEIEKQNFERKQKLYQEKIISDKAFQEAELKKKVAEVNFNYAMKKLLALGIRENEIDDPPSDHSEAVGSTIHLYSPISGILTYRDASIGQKVGQATKLFEIINLKTVWLEADIFEKDLTKIKIGQKVKVRVSAYPDEIFIGKIFFIGSTLNQQTKTINIMVEIRNTSEKLKPGMFANTNIVIGEKANALVVPKNAILEDENLIVVFVKEQEGYHRHVISPGIESDEFIEVLAGLKEGDVVVTKGNYQLKSKLKMSGVDPHAGHVH